MVWVHCDVGGDMTLPTSGCTRFGIGRDQSLRALERGAERKATGIDRG